MPKSLSTPSWAEWGALTLFFFGWYVEWMFSFLQATYSLLAASALILTTAMFALGCIRFRKEMIGRDSLLYFSMPAGLGFVAIFGLLTKPLDISISPKSVLLIAIVCAVYTLTVPFRMRNNRGLAAFAALGHSFPLAVIMFSLLQSPQ